MTTMDAKPEPGALLAEATALLEDLENYSRPVPRQVASRIVESLRDALVEARLMEDERHLLRAAAGVLDNERKYHVMADDLRALLARLGTGPGEEAPR